MRQHRKKFRNSLIYVCILDTRGRATAEGLTRIIPLACGAHTGANFSVSLIRKIRFAIIPDRFRASAFSRRRGMRIALCLVFRVISRSRETLTTARRTADVTFIEQSTSTRSFLPRGEERRTNTRHKNPSLVRKTLRPWIVTARVSKYSEWTPQNVVTRRRLRPTFIDEVGYWK